MPGSELGLTDRWGEQLFKVGPGNRCFAAAAKGNDWPKMNIAGLSMQAGFFSCIPFHTTTLPFPKNTEEGSVHHLAIHVNKTCWAANRITEQQAAHYSCVTRDFLNHKRGTTSWTKRMWTCQKKIISKLIKLSKQILENNVSFYKQSFSDDVRSEKHLHYKKHNSSKNKLINSF